jgi:hypothetical protein
MHLLLYVKSDFHVFYCDIANPPPSRLQWCDMFFTRILSEDDKWILYLVYETKLYVSHEISLVCICHNRHEIDSNLANNACFGVMISKFL